MVGFPLLLIPLAVYNIVVFLMRDVSFTEALFTLTLPSGAVWPVTLSDILIALGMVLLLLEVIKGARPGAKYLMDHLLSLVVFGAAAAEFVLWPKFASSTYFLLVLLAFVDFVSGIALRARRSLRYVTVEEAPRRSRARREEAGAAEPHVEPAPAAPPANAAPTAPPATPQPSAASVAESVLADHSGPNAAPPAADTAEQRSPALQPNSGAEGTPEPPQR
ncbi:hypothetical protein [Bradyrhizobium sp. ARR65]|uniref:hypothetical protein n=1 Tax=Bradyrhizobium sp. ARR65 TaxID=1040989 RepID=UPI0004653380|nr:hypothetical protein [Bradyrhizobium sp. ARR65]